MTPIPQPSARPAGQPCTPRPLLATAIEIIERGGVTNLGFSNRLQREAGQLPPTTTPSSAPPVLPLPAAHIPRQTRRPNRSPRSSSPPRLTAPGELRYVAIR